MSKMKAEINPIRAERVKVLIQRENITQQEFATKIFQTQQNVSRIINLKTALTETTARDIVRAFPEYRLSWLLGIDDYMTESDCFDGLMQRLDREHDDNIIVARHLSKLHHIDFQLYSSGMIQDETGRHSDCFLVRKDGKQAYITYNDLTDLICDLAALTDSRITRLIEKNQNPKTED